MCAPFLSHQFSKFNTQAHLVSRKKKRNENEVNGRRLMTCTKMETRLWVRLTCEHGGEQSVSITISGINYKIMNLTAHYVPLD